MSTGQESQQKSPLRREWTWLGEYDTTRLMVTHDPPALGDTLSAGLHSRSVRLKAENHARFASTLRENGIEVRTLGDLLMELGERSALRKFITDQLVLETDDQVGAPLTEEELDDFRERMVDGMTEAQLVQALTHQLRLRIGRRPSSGKLEVRSFEVSPLASLLELRLAIVTRECAVIGGKHTSPLHHRLMYLMLECLGLRRIVSLPPPLRLHGGDFIPAGPDLIFHGTGRVTDEASVRYMLGKHVFDVPRAAMVRDLFDRDPTRPCLDSVMKLLTCDTIALLRSVVGEDNPRRRLVTEFVRVSLREYRPVRLSVELHRYLLENDWNVVLVDSVSGICNLGDGKLLCGDPELCKQLNEFGAEHDSQIQATHLEFEGTEHKHDLLFHRRSLCFRVPSEHQAHFEAPDPEQHPWATDLEVPRPASPTQLAKDLTQLRLEEDEEPTVVHEPHLSPRVEFDMLAEPLASLASSPPASIRLSRLLSSQDGDSDSESDAPKAADSLDTKTPQARHGAYPQRERGMHMPRRSRSSSLGSTSAVERILSSANLNIGAETVSSPTPPPAVAAVTPPEHIQTSSAVMMVAPVGFCRNEETALDNFFMCDVDDPMVELERRALAEFGALHRELTSRGVCVLVYSAERFQGTPDAVFPNNWVSAHSADELGESVLVLYPMATESRRRERRQNIIGDLQEAYSRSVGFTQWEFSDVPHYLEGTGVLVLDRVRRIAYAAKSKRCYWRIALKWANSLGYRLVFFRAYDQQDRPIYHTNVMMFVGFSVAVVCLESVTRPEEREKLVSTLSSSHEIVEITHEQVLHFCGNLLEVRSDVDNRRYICMSSCAYNAFTEEQRATLLRHTDGIIHSPIPTIEKIGGGSVRCMLAELP
eukprot:CAMPEP_0174244868 /NCGR_PEP_ID=MMETSP0417-20130205/36863_1 /TAXON_ID=242541 /ORGANISM="Mayorella sp, Strain BSH-02190019" /LENGTH=875 /DNA_ID=CAMNT_0015324601 /DNA_START=83 /DNA_END=2710 /DNA_ORIENTATION=+